MRLEEALKIKSIPPPPPKVMAPPDRRTFADTSLSNTLPRLGYSRRLPTPEADSKRTLPLASYSKTKNMLLPVPKYGLDMDGQFAIPSLAPLGRGSAMRLFKPSSTWTE